MKPRRGDLVVRLILSGALIGTSALGAAAIGQASRTRARLEVARAAHARAATLQSLVTGARAELERRAEALAGSAPVLAVLAPDADPQALRDLLEDPDQGPALRGPFRSVAVAIPGTPPVAVFGASAIATGPAEIDLPRQAWERQAPVSAFVPEQGAVAIVVAVPIDLGEGGHSVLLLSRPFDAEALGPLIDRTTGAVAVAEGDRLLVGAGSFDEIADLKRALRDARDGFAEIVPGQSAFAALPIGPALSLVAHVDGRLIARRATLGYAVSEVAAAALGISLALLALVQRRRRDARLYERLDQPLSATVTETSSGSRYILLKKIGGGGMAEVHLALSVGERGFRRPCVVKRLRPELAEDPEAVAQFTDEATVASGLVHANIVPIFDFTQAGRDYFMVEEYVVGRDLGRLVRRASEGGEPLEPALVAHIGIEVCKALAYAHGRRDHEGRPLAIVHRDVSPENIMITSRGDVQLLDFGVLKANHADDDGQDEPRRRVRTETGKLQGSLRFMAPEQARGLEVDGRADLFSLGLTLYHALTGEPLYGSLRGYDLLVRVASGPGLIERDRLAALPAPFGEILTKVLSARDDRHADAEALAADLARATDLPRVELGARLGERLRWLFDGELAEEQSSLSASATAARTVLAASTPVPRFDLAPERWRQAR